MSNSSPEAMQHMVGVALGQYQPTGPRIHGTGSGIDVFRNEAVDGLAHIATDGRRGKASKVASRGAVPLMRQCLVNLGVANADRANEDAVIDATAQLMASGPVNRVGDFANIMASVSKIIMDDAAVGSGVSFVHFAEQLPDADSMDVASIGGFGVIDGLDAHTDGDNAKEIKLREESKGFLPMVNHANDICLTWLMHQDQLKFNNFLRAMASMAQAPYKTLNRAIMQAIGLNLPLIDGLALFENTVHGNLVVSGGAPSETNLIANRALHAAQRAPGMMSNSGTDPRIVLVPDAQRITAAKAFKTFFGTANGMAVANIEASQNYFKDSVLVLSDSELDNYSTTAWYSLVEPTNQGLRSFAYRYLRGHGPDRAMTQWVDHRRRGLVFSIDFVAGFSVTGWRGIVRNPG